MRTATMAFLKTTVRHVDMIFFDVHVSVRRKYIPIYIQQDATLHSLFISGNCSTCFGCYFHPSPGAHATVSTAPGICHTFTATCRYRGRVGSGLSVLWVAYIRYILELEIMCFQIESFPYELSANWKSYRITCLC
jgi:hypothetical protein